MDSDLDTPASGPNESDELAVDSAYSFRRPPRQEALLVTIADWNRIKNSIISIPLSESYWLTAMWSSWSFSVSFLVAILALEQQADVGFGYRAAFIALAAVGLVSGFVCLIAYLAGRNRRREQMNYPLRYMEEIEESSR